MVEQHQHELIVSAPDRPIWVNADPVRMVQVIGNLLSNACKYTQRGGRIDLTIRREGGEAEIVVRDNGVGIEPELVPKVFDLFMQGSRSLDRSQGGLGIGLTLVKNLVEMHRGSVAAQSEGPGRGSRFFVRLPAIEHEEHARPPKRRDRPPPRRVLVVDDNVGAAQMLSMLLAALGSSQLAAAHDGMSALAMLPEFRPEIVLLDIGLPGMDGYQVAAAIREKPEFDSILLVALTGYGQDEDRRKSQAAGFDEHLVKPPAVEAINKLLRHPKLSPETG
ncbi:MAG: response regulator [Planctomycetes bacterium]|nr:response regulator [Planctomycetota bacterium]